MQKISKNIYVESERSRCNTSVVVTKAGVVVIDTPMIPKDAKKVAADIEKLGPVRYVINTEPHGDHISGNCYFGGKVVTHEGTRDAILKSKVEDFKNMLKMMSPDDPTIPEDFRFRPPDITFTESLTLYLGDHTFKLKNMPGHTPYQLMVYVPEERIVFTGDNTVVAGTPFFHQAVPNQWLKSLKAYEELDVDIVVPGHGPVTDKSYFKKMYKIVKGCMDAVRAAIDKGMTLQEAQEWVTFDGILPDMPRDESMAEVRRMNVTRLYEILKKS
jgi:cyclase